MDVQYIHSGINMVKFSDNSLFYWRFGTLWTDNAPCVTNDETVIWVHIWQSARKQNFSHAFSRRPNHIGSIVNIFPEQGWTMSLVILQSCVFCCCCFFFFVLFFCFVLFFSFVVGFFFFVFFFLFFFFFFFWFLFCFVFSIWNRRIS